MSKPASLVSLNPMWKICVIKFSIKFLFYCWYLVFLGKAIAWDMWHSIMNMIYNMLEKPYHVIVELDEDNVTYATFDVSPSCFGNH